MLESDPNLLLEGESIKLRALEIEDLPHLYEIENDSVYWHLTDNLTPYSRHTLEAYILQGHKDIFEAKQLRLVIAPKQETSTVIGLVDLYNFDPQHRKVAIGIYVYSQYRNKGSAKETLGIIERYVFKKLFMRQLYAFVPIDNIPSSRLFESAGFKKTAVISDWILKNIGYIDCTLFQKIVDEKK